VQVSKWLNIIYRLARIMELYRGKSVEEMLDDIYAHVTRDNNTLTAGVAEAKKPEMPETKVLPPERKIKRKGTEKISPEEIARIIPTLKKTDILVALKPYTKQELLLIAEILNISIYKRDKVDNLRQVIANYYSLNNLY
jgi:hypothetical protein